MNGIGDVIVLTPEGHVSTPYRLVASHAPKYAQTSVTMIASVRIENRGRNFMPLFCCWFINDEFHVNCFRFC